MSGRVDVPTPYAGLVFRSRLHAAWAAFFDLAGWGWDYQPDEFSGFAPTFRLDFHRPLYVIVDPVGRDSHKHPAFLVASTIGVPRLLILGDAPHWRGGNWSTLGLLASEDTSYSGDEAPAPGWIYEGSDYAEFAICTECDRFTLFPETQSFTCQVCDAYEGGNNRHCLTGDHLWGLWVKAWRFVNPGRMSPLRSPSPRERNPYDPFAEEGS